MIICELSISGPGVPFELELNNLSVSTNVEIDFTHRNGSWILHVCETC